MENHSIEAGIITRVYVENFVTYNTVEIKPGRNFNVIIGPNGTGKSTIACAIILGLGGKPKIIGRGKNVSDYIKTGSSEAIIEIELKKNKKQTTSICRKIISDNSSKWTIDKNPVSFKHVVELITKFNIQVDNLCQFLPQDQVQNFSKMNAQELLESTERSIGDSTLLEKHNSLKEQRSEQIKLEKELNEDRSTVAIRTEKYENLKEVVGSIKERKKIKTRINHLKQKKAWMIYDKSRRKLVMAKKSRDEVASKMKKVDEEIAPINKLIEKTKTEIYTLQHSVQNHSRKTSSQNTELNNLIKDILQVHENVKETSAICSQRIEQQQSHEQEINSIKKKKSKLENDLRLLVEEIGSEESLQQKQNDISGSIQDLKCDINNMRNKNMLSSDEIVRLDHELRVKESELSSLNIEVQRLELLKQRSKDTYQGVLWLRQNKDKFQGEVYEPPLLNINVKHSSYAKYLESIISWRDLIAFVFEDKQDMNLLLTYLRDQQKLQVNAVHSDPKRNVHMEPRIPLKDIQHFGFKHYLVSLFEAPPTVMKYLVYMYNLNNIPIGSKQIENCVDNIPPALNCYFSENTIYSTSISKYTNAKSVRMSQISGAGSLSIIMDVHKIEVIKNSINSYKERKIHLNASIDEINQKINLKNEEKNKMCSILNNYKANVEQIQNLKSHINLFVKKLTTIKESHMTVEEIKKDSTKKIQKLVHSQLKNYKSYNKIFNDLFKSAKSNGETKLALQLNKFVLDDKENILRNMKEKFEDIEKEFKILDAELKPLKDNTTECYKVALELSEGVNPQDKEFKSMNDIFKKLPSTIEEIDKEIHTAEAKVFCLGENLNANEILKEYDKLEKNITELNVMIEQKTTQLENLKNNLESLSEQWITPLKGLIKKINENFTFYFSTMKCAGEVSLSHGDNPMDFDQYGLSIKVKFRDGDELHELTRHRQSGGERALTTAIYMIAMQDLSVVPFRCVDEINQGMDATNEKRVFDLLVAITAKPTSPQYFLITPKLLPNLEYASTVTVHCVFNGPRMIGHTKFNVQYYCKCLNKGREESSDDE